MVDAAFMFLYVLGGGIFLVILVIWMWLRHLNRDPFKGRPK